MSLTKEAIEKIGAVSIQSAAVNTDKLQEVDYKAVVLPRDTTIKTLEELQRYRNRFRGRMDTASIQDFVEYSLDKQNDGVKCFVDHDEIVAVTIFNLGNDELPGHADDRAILQLKRTADYKAILAINGEKHRQKYFAEWLEDWRDNIKAYTQDGEELDIKLAIAAVRKLTVEASRKSEHEVSDMSASRSVLENVEAKSTNTLPSIFTFTCIPYNGLKPRNFTLRLSITTGGEEPCFVTRIVRLEAVTEEITEEFKQLLVSKFAGSKVQTFIGNFEIR